MPHPLLLDLFGAAIAAADPLLCVPPFLPPPPKGRTVVVGAGKGAAAMAKAVEDNWPGPLSGLVVTRHGHALGHAVPGRRIEIIEAAHPVPDAAGQAAAARILKAVQGLGEDDLVLCLISGGGSALLALPAPGLALADKQALGKALLRSGAPISAINTVRKHLSAIKGGRLALAAWPAPVVTLAISDVPGDDPSVIASGPTVADATTCADALAVLERYGIEAPPAALALLRNGQTETPKPLDPRLSKTDYRLVATPAQSLAAAAALAEARGFAPLVLGDAIEGEARDVAAQQAALALKTSGPRVILSGGETTVTLRGHGRGGRNAEFLLALTLALGGHPHIHAIACDTDGIDGTEDNAGAICAPDSLARAQALGLDAAAYLADNDAWSFFKALDDLVVTGPTRTNVNDFRAILIER